MPRPSEALIHETQCQLAREGRLGCAIGSRQAYHRACSELGRRSGRKRRAASMAALSLPDPSAQGRGCLPPGDRD